MQTYIRALSWKAEFAIVVIGAFGYFTFSGLLWLVTTDRVVSDIDFIGLVVLEAILLIVLGAFLHLQGWTTQRIGLRPTFTDTIKGLGLALVCYVAYCIVLILAVALSLIDIPDGEAPAAYTPALSLATIILLAIVNSVFEETFVAGYIISILKERAGFWIAINVSVAVRLLYHLYQGPLGMMYIIPLGLIFGYWYARTGRLWPLIVAHGATNLTTLSLHAFL